MAKYYYAKVENGCIKLPQELLEKIGGEEGDIVEFVQIGDVDLQISFIESWNCPYGNTETKEKCYKCSYHERCRRTERVQKLEQR